MRRFWQRLTPTMVWDGVMVYLAILNLLLIGFDLSYLWVRPFYARHAPWVAELYDPVKGIQPHPFAEEYLAEAQRLEEALAAGDPEEAAARLARLRELSGELLADNPFAWTRPRDLERVKLWVLRATEREPRQAERPEAVAAAFREMWSPGEGLEGRLALFEAEVRPLFEAAYYRGFQPGDDDLVDWFWLIDLPFLLLFAGEFFARWAWAVRRGEYRRWYHFALFHWYDALGLVPYLRGFRLFRIVSIYLRLRRSSLTRVGDDVISRAVAQVSEIIAEEISDLVTVRILASAQEMVREGVYADIIRRSLLPRRAAIRAELTTTVEELMASPGLRADLRELLRLNLEQSLESAAPLRGLPVPQRLLGPLVAGIGDAVFEALMQTVADTLATEGGRDALGRALETVTDAVMEDLTGGDLEALIESISLEILQRTKERVAIREWAGEVWEGPGGP